METRNQKIKKCIACPVAHKLISEYLLLCKAYKTNKQSKGKNSKNKQNLRNIIENIFEILHINGTYDEKVEFLYKIYNTSNPDVTINELFPELKEISECIRTFRTIITLLKIFFNEQEESWEEVAYLHKNGINILNDISDFLVHNKIKTEILTSEEKHWDTDYRKTLGYISKEYDDNYEYEDEYEESLIEEQREEERATNTYNKFKMILIDYCQNSIGKVSYEYCEPIHGYDKSLKNCQSNSLQMLKETNNSLGIRLFKLDDRFRNIAYNYLEKAPKKFSDVLARVMEHQNLGYTEVAELWNNKKKHASSVQKLTTSDNNKLTDEDKKTLQKILLVSEDMLICGSGRIYGNWNDVLKNQTDPEERKILLNHYEERLYTSTKGKIRNDIIELINNDEKFEEARKTSDFFCDDYLCVYTCIDDYSNELCYDYNAMYENLLHPEDFDTLLSVLEELQAQENN